MARGAPGDHLDVRTLSGRERLLFAQAVYEYGGQAWSEVGKILSQHPLLHRPNSFWSAQTCSTIYNQLMDNAALERPEDSDVKHAPFHLQLAQIEYNEHVMQLKKEIFAAEMSYKALVNEIDDIRAGKWDDKILAAKAARTTRPPQDSTPGRGFKSDGWEYASNATRPFAERSPAPNSLVIADYLALENAKTLIEVKQEGTQPSLGEETVLNGPLEIPLDDIPISNPDEKASISEDSNPSISDLPPEKVAKPIIDGSNVVERDLTSDVSSIRTRSSKRKDSSGSLTVEHLRGRRRTVEELDPAEDSELASSSATLSDAAKIKRKRFQNVIYLLHSQISQHRFGNIFHNPIKETEAPDYHEIVKRPMDLKTVKARVRDGMINSSREFQRDIYLMFANAMMYNRPNSDIYAMTEEMMHESEVNINTFRQTEGFARTRL